MLHDAETIDEIIEFGLFGWSMSRFSGCYVALKCVTDTLDLSGCIELPDPFRAYTVPADIQLPPQGLNLRPNLPPLVEEEALVNHRLPAATAFARANGDQEGQIFALVVMVVAACEVVVGLGLIVAMFRRRLSLNVDDLRDLRG